jgi:hypothetical protein
LDCAGFVHRPEQRSVCKSRRRYPLLDEDFRPDWHRDRPHPIFLPDQVRQNPPRVAQPEAAGVEGDEFGAAQPLGESEENLTLMRLLDEQYTRAPFYDGQRHTAIGTDDYFR